MRLPLSSAAIAIIESLPKFKDCDWLIPNLETKEPFVSIKHSWDATRTEAKLRGLRLHDLRHSPASAMINSGVDNGSSVVQAAKASLAIYIDIGEWAVGLDFNRVNH